MHDDSYNSRMLPVGAAALSPSKVPDPVASNVALGRRVFVEVYGESKINLVDQLMRTTLWMIRLAEGMGAD